MGIPMLKIRRSWDCLIFNMEIPILVRRHLYIEMPIYWDGPQNYDILTTMQIHYRSLPYLFGSKTTVGDIFSSVNQSSSLFENYSANRNNYNVMKILMFVNKEKNFNKTKQIWIWKSPPTFEGFNYYILQKPVLHQTRSICQQVFWSESAI